MRQSVRSERESLVLEQRNLDTVNDTVSFA